MDVILVLHPKIWRSDICVLLYTEKLKKSKSKNFYCRQIKKQNENKRHEYDTELIA